MTNDHGLQTRKQKSMFKISMCRFLSNKDMYQKLAGASSKSAPSLFMITAISVKYGINLGLCRRRATRELVKAFVYYLVDCIPIHTPSFG